VPLFTGRRANRVSLIAQVCVGLVQQAAFGGQGWQQFARPAPNLYGICQVDGFSAEGYRRDPLLTDELTLEVQVHALAVDEHWRSGSAATGPGSLGPSLKNAPLSKVDHGPHDCAPNLGIIGFADN
jgi:hypothetical protein